jgi:alanine racemase
MLFSELEKLTHGKFLQLFRDLPVENLVTDSRKAIVNSGSVFFAISGPRNDGHQYLLGLYQLGIRQFVIEKPLDALMFPEANLLLVDSSITGLQNIAQAHREKFNFPVIAITGSNGKTIIKEWMFQLLSPDFKTVKNPGSYNSQIGVPLSIWSIQLFHELGIFEAGISTVDEMESLEKIIQPTIGVFANIGSAHDEGFDNLQQKISEKLKLFKNVKKLIYCADHSEIDQVVRLRKIETLSWGRGNTADIRIERIDSHFQVTFQQKSFSLSFPFIDKASVENTFHCVAVMLHFGYDHDVIQKRITDLRPVSMRLELKEGINNCQIIDDTYNNDLAGLQISLDFLSSQQKKNKSVILSDVLQSGMREEEIAQKISSMLQKNGVTKFIGIGPQLHSQEKNFGGIPSTSFFNSIEDFINSFDFNSVGNEVILVKGARIFQFERIVQLLQSKAHGTVMQIDLSKMIHNLNFFKSKLNPGVKIMAMVKAFAYGNGSEEVANLLQYHKVAYLGVAYSDEGVDLRKKNISLPIMVMNPTEESFESLLSNNLEPAMYSLKMLRAFASFLNGREGTVHLEVETGMQRLGLSVLEWNEAFNLLKLHKNIRIASAFSHLSGSDESIHDGFSNEQFDRYQKFYSKLSTELNIKPLRHILNSAGILRLPNFQMDMVRLGIGLYGIDPTMDKSSKLQPVATLKTIISQIKKISKGETVGYGRKGKAENELTIATIAIGYADGFSRSFSRGKGAVLVNGQKASVIGNVCMDMTMVDITGIVANEGDEVIIFGDGYSIHDVAKSIDTIPYEILTNTSSRVKRVFVAEGI